MPPSSQHRTIRNIAPVHVELRQTTRTKKLPSNKCAESSDLGRPANEFSMTKKSREAETKKNRHAGKTQRLLHAMSRQRKYQLRHKRAGLCGECSRPAASGTLFCELHRRKRNLENRERQRKRFKRKLRYLKAESYTFTGSDFYERKSAHIFRSAMVRSRKVATK